MKFNIYNYDNVSTSVDTGDKEIEYITVEVITGDEVIHIHFTDGTRSHYKSDVALVDFYDGDYVVPKERIQEWIDLEKVTNKTISYYRLEVFEKDDEKKE